MVRARCPVCHLTISVSSTGALFAHEYRSKRCTGTGLEAAELDPPVTAKPANPPKISRSKRQRTARENSAARAMLKALTPRHAKPKKMKLSPSEAAKSAAALASRREAAEASRLRYEANMKARYSADQELGRTPKPKAPDTSKRKAKRSVWTVRGGLPGLGKRS